MDIVLSYLRENRTRLNLTNIPDELSTLMLTPRFPASRHVVFLVLPHDHHEPLLVAKIPRLREMSNSLQREAQNLEAIQASRPQGFGTIPAVVAFEIYRNYPILLETALNGPQISPGVVRCDPSGCTEKMQRWLVDVQRVTALEDREDLWYFELVQRALNDMQEHFPLTESEEVLLEKTEAVLRPLKDAVLPYVLEHGDLSHPNLILMPSGEVGVVDWELSDISGLLASDFFFFLSYVTFSVADSNRTGDYLGPFDSAFFGADAWTKPHIRSYAEAMKIPSNLLPPLFVLCWFRYLVKLMRRLQVDGHSKVASHVADTVRQNRYYAMWEHTVNEIGRLQF